MTEESEWARFYQTLNRLGPRLLTNVPEGYDQYIRMEAEDTDNFWSGALEQAFSYWADGDRALAVRRALEYWVLNVQQHLAEILGPDSLIPFEGKGISWEERQQDILQIEEIRLRLDEEHLQLFIDSVVLDSEQVKCADGLLVQCIVQAYKHTSEGVLIHAVSIPWKMIVNELRENWRIAFQLSSRQWEEMLAAAFDRAGYDEVILTPRSRDHGRDVIATKNGVGSIRVIDSVKAYSPILCNNAVVHKHRSGHPSLDR